MFLCIRRVYSNTWAAREVVCRNPAHWSLISILSIFLLGIESLNFSWAHGYQARNNIFQLHTGVWAVELCPGQWDVKGEDLCSSGDIFTPLFCPFTQAVVW